MINPRESINFFIGSGASSAFGFPSMTKITQEFRKKLHSKAYPESAFSQERNSLNNSLYFDQNKKIINIYDRIYNTLDEYYLGKVDVEAIMSVVIGLKENTNFAENTGDFGLYQIYRKSTSPNFVFNLDEDSIEDLNLLEQRYKEFIRSSMSFDQHKVDLIEKIYDNFFGVLHSLITKNELDEDTIPYSKINSSLHNNFNIFTTNYDTAIEKYFKDIVEYKEFDTGAIGFDSEIKMDEFIKRYWCRNNETRMKIIKLHGSVNWIKDEKNRLIQKSLEDNYDRVRSMNSSNSIKDEVIIYPLSQKKLYLTPFIQLYYYLEKELSNDKIWIVIGYSFRDPVIRHLFENSINNMKCILLVDPRSETIKKLFSEDAQKKIFTLRAEFGNKENYDETNKEIVIQLKEIFQDI
ncbi:SIR2 family protein [Candidatus Nitrosocosmicus sp. T]